MHTSARTGDLSTALQAAESRYAAANPESKARHARACVVMPAGHTRQTLYFAPFPLTVARGHGASVTDVDGH